MALSARFSGSGTPVFFNAGSPADDRFLIPRFRQRGTRDHIDNDCHPAGLSGLPGILIFPAHVGAVDHLIVVGRVAVDHDAERRADNGLEARRRFAEFKVHVHYFTLLRGYWSLPWASCIDSGGADFDGYASLLRNS